MKIEIVCPGHKTPTQGAYVGEHFMRREGHEVWHRDSAAQQASMPWALSRGDGVPDVVFMSILGHRDMWSVGSVMRSVTAPVVIGGQYADSLEWMADAYQCVVFVGDITAGVSDLYNAIDARRADVIHAGQGPLPDAIRGDHSTTVYIGDGCDMGCPYCRIGRRSARWLDASRVEDAIRSSRTKSINLYSPSGLHPRMRNLLGVMRECGRSSSNSDFHPAMVRGMSRLDILPRSVYTGIEFADPDLRAKYHREISPRELENLSAIRHLKLYMLAGVPGETDDHWRDFANRYLLRLRGRPSVTVTELTPLPGTPWGDLPGHWNRSAWERCMRLRAAMRDTQRDGRMIIVSQPKGRELHECEVVTIRAANRVFVDLMKPSLVPSGRWRSAVKVAGIDIDAVLSAGRTA